MIHKLSIRNFKSIRELDLDCRRVNVFIGEPNAGKTNILEALSMECFGALSRLKSVCRIERFVDLIKDQDETNKVEIGINTHRIELSILDKRVLRLDWHHQSQMDPLAESDMAVFIHADGKLEIPALNKDRTLDYLEYGTHYYLFDPDAVQRSGETAVLEAPYGQNLASYLAADKQARITLSSLFPTGRYRPTIDRSQDAVLLAHEEDGTLITLPFKSSSETLRRMLFYYLALQSHEHGTIIFDEPEAHSFPPYTKTLAERIALDDRGNQFFLTTHSPYMLDSLLS
ncbi:MAG: AAA family ATPase, partial [Prosthecobacter sp.]|nr:AAA family ATPase [Prosthecobacter sp.]